MYSKEAGVTLVFHQCSVALNSRTESSVQAFVRVPAHVAVQRDPPKQRRTWSLVEEGRTDSPEGNVNCQVCWRRRDYICFCFYFCGSADGVCGGWGGRCWGEGRGGGRGRGRDSSERTMTRSVRLCPGPHFSPSASVQDGIYALGKAHTRSSTPISLKEFSPNVVFSPLKHSSDVGSD